MIEDKWKFVPEQKCLKCYTILTEENTKGEIVVTGCPSCKYSFLE